MSNKQVDLDPERAGWDLGAEKSQMPQRHVISILDRLSQGVSATMGPSASYGSWVGAMNQGFSYSPSSEDEIIQVISPTGLDSYWSPWILEPPVIGVLDKICSENENERNLREHGLEPAKVLGMTGSPGSGQAEACSYIADRLGLAVLKINPKLFGVNPLLMDNLLSSKLAAKLLFFIQPNAEFERNKDLHWMIDYWSKACQERGAFTVVSSRLEDPVLGYHVSLQNPQARQMQEYVKNGVGYLFPDLSEEKISSAVVPLESQFAISSPLPLSAKGTYEYLAYCLLPIFKGSTFFEARYSLESTRKMQIINGWEFCGEIFLPKPF